MRQDECKVWYVLASKPSQDACAEEQLNNHGYTVYRPLAMRERRRRGRLVKVTESLFSCYFFIRLDRVDDSWASISSTYGVAGFVQFGSLALSVPDGFVASLRQKERQFQEKAIDLDRFRHGDVVRMIGGAFQGMGAVLECYDGERRAVLLMKMLNEQPNVEEEPIELYKMA